VPGMLVNGAAAISAACREGVASTAVATTTAWGDGDPLDVVLDRIAAHDVDVQVVELAIGARSVVGVHALLAQWASTFTFIAHHTAPVTDTGTLRPDLHADPAAVARALNDAGVAVYSGHPPSRKFASPEQMWDWAVRWWDTLAQAGISWSVETMYVPRTRDEERSTGGYHLATPAEVWSFCERASAVGWEHPLLVDASHLHIGWCGGSWTEADVCEVIASAPASELHISTNDGRRDIHAPLETTDRVWSWVEPHLDRYTYVVDEGRRRGRYELTHVAHAS
jgi:hypothetical protein